MKKITISLVFMVLVTLQLFSQTKPNSFKNVNRNNTGKAIPVATVKAFNNKGSVKITSFTQQISVQKQEVTDLHIIRNPKNHTPLFIQKQVSGLKSASNLSSKDQCFTFLNNIKNEMQIVNPINSFQIASENDDQLGMKHMRLQQTYKGIKVYNSDFYVHLNTNSQIMNGTYCVVPVEISTSPKISYANALETARNDLSKTSNIQTFDALQSKLVKYAQPTNELVIFKSDNETYHLAYSITICPNLKDEWKYIVDATTSAILEKYNNTPFDGPVTANATDLNGVVRSINTYLESGKYYMIDLAEPMFNATKGEGMIRTLNAQNTSASKLSYVEITSNNNTWTLPAAVSAHYNATQTYRYFKNTFNRNSINGQGGNIFSLINVTEDDGSSMENAFWNGAAIFYGNGGTIFKPLAGALDVAAHEIGHGVTQNTAGLEYQGESGAMNEAYSDIFGAMVDRSNWYIGEEITKSSYISTGRLRDMSDPHNGNGNGWQPNHTKEMYKGTEDNGGVHTNSGIINYAFYLYATAITKDKAEQVFYRALTNYLTKSSGFIDLRLAVIQSATDLYGGSSAEVTQAKTAFDAVGIYEEQPVEENKTYPENPGTEYLLVSNTDPADPNSLYRSTPTATELKPLSTTLMARRASVVDNGNYCVFVSTDHKIRSVTLNTATPTETILSNDTIWDNVAISKDGNRLAAISKYIDSAIYVYDFVGSKWTQFKLFSPTTQTGVVNYNVIYADAIEFDHTGQYLIYDAFNSLNNQSGNDISYWDIGVIKVWDNKTNKTGDGSISKLYGSLPEKVSIGNPTFSKNNPNLIAFDYLNESTNEYAVYGLNLETYDLGLIASNNTIGYPSFSKSDTKVAFTALNNSSKYIINVATLNADKISSSTTPENIIVDAGWPVFYATGTRVLGFSPLADFTVSYKTGSIPFTVDFTDNSKYDPTTWEWTFPGGTPTSSTAQNPSVTYNTIGNYTVTLKVTNSFGNNTLTKTGYIVVTALDDLKAGKKIFTLKSNPVNSYFELNKPEYFTGNFEVKLYDLSGKLVLSETNKSSVSISNLPRGIYTVNVSWDKQTENLKLVKE